MTDVTETLAPANVSFQDWQVRELDGLLGSAQERGGAMNALECRSARVDLGGRTIWRDVDLDIPEHEFVAILGPNGVGKSTLLNAILGLVPLGRGRSAVARPAAGRVEPRHRVPAPTAQLRSVGTDPRRRRRATRARRRPLRDPAPEHARSRPRSRSASTSWSISSARTTTRTVRSVSARVVSNSDCSIAQALGAASTVVAARRTARQPRPSESVGCRRARRRASVGAKASRC